MRSKGFYFFSRFLFWLILKKNPSSKKKSSMHSFWSDICIDNRYFFQKYMGKKESSPIWNHFDKKSRMRYFFLESGVFLKTFLSQKKPQKIISENLHSIFWFSLLHIHSFWGKVWKVERIAQGSFCLTLFTKIGVWDQQKFFQTLTKARTLKWKFSQNEEKCIFGTFFEGKNFSFFVFREMLQFSRKSKIFHLIRI